MSLVSSLRRVIPVLLLGTFSFAFGQSAVRQPAVLGSSSKAASVPKSSSTLFHSPTDAVIGAHLADWVKQGKNGSAAARKAKANLAGVQVQAPAFYAAPFLSLANWAQ